MTRAWIPLAMAALAPFVACKANLESSCEDGTCTGATVAAASSGTGDCVGENTFGLPCDVYTIIDQNCHACHVNPPKNGAPFPIVTYDDTQARYYNTQDKIWQHMKIAVEPGAVPGMPFGNNPPGLPEAELNVLRAWFATCDAGMCARAPGSGGAGGGGSTSSTSSGTGTTTSSTSGSASSSSSGSTGTGN